MADNRQELAGVNWNEVFSFSHIFKSFRMSIHLSKLALALAAIVVIFVTGWVMDSFWAMGGGYAGVDEIRSYLRLSSEQFQGPKDKWLDTRKAAAADLKERSRVEREKLTSYMVLLSNEIRDKTKKSYLLDAMNELKSKEEPPAADPKKFEDEPWSDSVEDANEHFGKELETIEKLLDRGYDEAEKKIEADDEALPTSDDEEEALDKREDDYRAALRAITRRKVQFAESQQEIRGKRVFSSLCDHESNTLSNAVAALCRLDITTGLNVYHNVLEHKAGRLAATPDIPGDNDAGFIFWMLASCHGVQWFICQHPIYAIIFLLISLAAWALFGGAIHRMAALHAAREEKISIAQALRFSASKFLSFFLAPLILLFFGILIPGLLLIVGGLLGNVMGFGAIVVGLLFVFAILLGLVIAFATVGLVTGAGLMYPTIAVEGSDAFDAISRSFSYVFGKPWRTILYGVIALIYGVLCYLFVRFFAYLALASSHFFAKLGIWAGGDALREGADRLDVMWQAPTFTVFHAPSNWEAMSTSEQIGAFIISIWVYLVIGMVLAFVLSYAASATTVIYYLLRRKVDATDLDDVYVEEAEEELPAPEEAPAEAEAEQPAEGGEEPPEGGEEPAAPTKKKKKKAKGDKEEAD